MKGYSLSIVVAIAFIALLPADVMFVLLSGFVLGCLAGLASAHYMYRGNLKGACYEKAVSQ
jgi:hypothetical protein